MKLLEVFDSPYNFADVEYRGKEIYYRFTSENGVAYKIGFRSGKSAAGETATVAFGLADDKVNLFAKDQDRKVAENSFRVLATVVAAMRDYLGQHPGLQAFHFSIDKNVDAKGSLEGVYNKMIDRLTPPRWSVRFLDSGDKSTANYIITLPAEVQKKFGR